MPLNDLQLKVIILYCLVLKNRRLTFCLFVFFFISEMRLVITKDYNEMSDWGARYIKKRINDFKPGPDRFFVLGLPTGMFKFLVVFFFN